MEEKIAGLEARIANLEALVASITKRKRKPKAPESAPDAPSAPPAPEPSGAAKELAAAYRTRVKRGTSFRTTAFAIDALLALGYSYAQLDNAMILYARDLHMRNPIDADREKFAKQGKTFFSAEEIAPYIAKSKPKSEERSEKPFDFMEAMKARREGSE